MPITSKEVSQVNHLHSLDLRICTCCSFRGILKEDQQHVSCFLWGVLLFQREKPKVRSSLSPCVRQAQPLDGRSLICTTALLNPAMLVVWIGGFGI